MLVSRCFVAKILPRLIDWLNFHISWSQSSSPWSHTCAGAQRKTAQINIVHTTTKEHANKAWNSCVLSSSSLESRFPTSTAIIIAICAVLGLRWRHKLSKTYSPRWGKMPSICPGVEQLLGFNLSGAKTSPDFDSATNTLCTHVERPNRTVWGIFSRRQ